MSAEHVKQYLTAVRDNKGRLPRLESGPFMVHDNGMLGYRDIKPTIIRNKEVNQDMQIVVLDKIRHATMKKVQYRASFALWNDENDQLLYQTIEMPSMLLLLRRLKKRFGDKLVPVFGISKGVADKSDPIIIYSDEPETTPPSVVVSYFSHKEINQWKEYLEDGKLPPNIERELRKRRRLGQPVRDPYVTASLATGFSPDIVR